VRVCSKCRTEYEDKSDHFCSAQSQELGPPGQIGDAWFFDESVDSSAEPARGALMPATAVSAPINLSPLHEQDSEESGSFYFHVEKQEDPNLGKVIAERYRIISMVGRGGMGMVYKADHLTIDRTVAIKMLYPNVVADADAIKRFKQEAQAVSKVEHPNSVRIYDFGLSDLGQPYLVMDFIDGGSLREALKDGPLNIVRAQTIFSQIVEALVVAHRVGVVHKDLKPENIMLSLQSSKGDWVQVVDFGISTMAKSDFDPYGAPQRKETRGSPPYMSPEQCTSIATIDERSDVYSLAIVLYECLSGKLPFNARAPLEMLEAHISGKPVPLTATIPQLAACQGLSDMLMKAMEKRPEKRQQTIEEFGNDLRDAAKRDQIHQSFLKNRKETLDGSSTRLPALPLQGKVSSDGHPVVSPEKRPGSTPASPIPLLPDANGSGDADALKNDKNLWKSLVNTFSNIAEVEEPQPENKYVFRNCPHCNEAVDADIAFCLSCGRSLSNTQEFSKIRASQGVFTLPKSQGSVSSTLPSFSQKTRAVSPASSTIRNANKSLLLVSLILAISIFWVAGGVDFVAKTIAKMGATRTAPAD